MPRPFTKSHGKKEYVPSITFFKNKFDGFSARIDNTTYEMLGKAELDGFMNLYPVPEEQQAATERKGKQAPRYRLYLKPPSKGKKAVEDTPAF